MEYFKYRREGHKYRECSLWEKVRKRRVKERVAYVAMPQKAQRKELRRVEKERVACIAKP